MMDCSLRSLDRVLRSLLTLDRLNSWRKVDLVVEVFLGLFLTDYVVLGGGAGAIRDVFKGCLRWDSIGGGALLLNRPR
jgi:hypothetical protein